MSTARVENPSPEPAHHQIVRRTVEACRLAKEAAGAAAEGIATGSAPLLNSLRQRERQLDALDMEIDTAVTAAITEVEPAEARELLACMKFMISLERIGDLLLSFANSAQAAAGRVDSQDTRDLTQMATILEKMLTDVGGAFSTRDVGKAVDVIRADSEIDRLRNLIFLRHIENPENIARQASLQVIFMTQSLERAGDHAKISPKKSATWSADTPSATSSWPMTSPSNKCSSTICGVGNSISGAGVPPAFSEKVWAALNPQAVANKSKRDEMELIFRSGGP